MWESRRPSAGDEQDTEDVPSENVELAGRIAQAMAPGDFVTLLEDEERLLAAASAVEPYADPEFETVMVGPEYLPDGAIYEGLEGYVEAWRDWLAPYESYRAELEGWFDGGDNVVLFVRQVAQTAVGGVPIEAESAVVFSFREGRLVRLEFHLDRDRALKVAGLAE
jgi:ketosteroid isomerase-like protein